MRKAVVIAILLLSGCVQPPTPKEISAPEQCAKDEAAKFMAAHPNSPAFWYLQNAPLKLTDFYDETSVTPTEAKHLLEIIKFTEKCYTPVFDNSDTENYFKHDIKRCRDALVARSNATYAYMIGRFSRGTYLSKIYKQEWPYHLCSEAQPVMGATPPPEKADPADDSDDQL